MNKKIPQSVIDLLQPEKDFSYVEYLGQQKDNTYYILSYYKEVCVGFPMVVLWKNSKATMLDIDEAFQIIDLFIKD